jgi:hypothetical protein
MTFFEPPKPPELPPEPEEFDEPEWFGAPRNILGAAAPLRLVLARTDECVVAVTDATAYPTGFEFKLVVRSRRGPDAEFDPFEMDPLQFHHPLMWRRMKSAFERDELPPELFRFGIAFADGSKATTLGGHPLGHDPREKPTRPVLRPRRRGRRR